MAVIERIFNDAIYIAEKLRLGRHLETNERFITLTNQLSPLSETLQPQQLTELQQLLMGLMQAQQRQDWLAMADYLEYDLIEFYQQQQP